MRDIPTTVNRNREEQRPDESRYRRAHALRGPRDGRCGLFDVTTDACDRAEE